MPIPLILLGAAALAGGFGVKKGVDATSLFKSLKTENLQAQHRYDSASKEFEKTLNATRISFEVLGNQKIETYKNTLIPFVDAFSLIKNVDFKDGRIFDEASLTVTQGDMVTLLDVSLKMKDVITAGVGCLGGGGLTALAAYGVNGLFGTASAGSALSSVAGAAATNSALVSIGGGMAAGACVGGGAMAGAGCMAGAAGGMAGVAGGMAGGMGMGGGAGAMAGAAGGMGLGGGAGAMAGAAGGMGMGGGAGAMAGTAGGMGMCGGAGAMAGAGSTAGGVSGGVVSRVAGGVAGGTVGAVTGGVTGSTVAGVVTLCGMVAGPFLAVGGMVLASKAKKAKADAGTNIGRINAAIEQIKNKQLATEAAFCRVYTILSVLGRLDERFTPLLAEVQQLVVVSNDYSSYGDQDKKVVMMAAMLAKTIKNVMETSILDDTGMITSASGQMVAESERVIQAIAL